MSLLQEHKANIQGTLRTESKSPPSSPKSQEADVVEIDSEATVKTTVTSSTTLTRDVATKKRKDRQEAQAKKMKKLRTKSEDKLVAKVGSIVTVKADPQDVSHENAIPGVVVEVLKSGAGGVVVVSEVGIICQGVTKSPYYIPVERYAVKSDDVVLSSTLTKIRQEILEGDDNYKKMPLKSVRAIHEELYGEKRYRK